MAVPDFQTIMLPLLNEVADGDEHRTADVINALAKYFSLSDEDREERLPSGRQSKFANRVGWARTHLSKAGLLASTGHGRFRITTRGLELLKTSPAAVTMSVLERYPEYIAFRTPGSAAPPAEPGETPQTPEEVIASSYEEFLRALSEDLLQQVKQRSPEFFENLVVDLLVKMGYGGSLLEAGRSIGRSGDGGVDGIIKEDKLGLDVLYVQAKRWESSVGRPLVQAFAGSLEGHRARKGVMITTSKFTDSCSGQG
jgi:restriction system protein